MSAYELLIQKLDAFIRKYYKNLLIKGLIYFLAIALVDYLLVTLLEYYGRFHSGVRAFLFYSSLALILFIFYRYLIVPLAGLLSIGKRINHEQASRIIGEHFGEVKDKLLNTLQLNELAGKDIGNQTLIEASIRQKSEELKPIPFVQAIDFKANRKYLKYLIIPVVAGIGLFFINARIMREGTLRLVQYNKEFAEEAPFKFILENKDLKAGQNDEVELILKLQGEEIPQDVYFLSDGKRYKMNAMGGDEHRYLMRNLQKDFDFDFEAGTFQSETYHFQVVSKALMAGMKIHLNYPTYTGLKDESLDNTGDLNIPEGTRVNWDIQVKNAQGVWIRLGEEPIEYLKQKGEDDFRISRNLFKNLRYYIGLEREKGVIQDSVPFQINIIQDAYPSIQVQEKEDNSQGRVAYFVGEVSDDYGFSSLQFVYHFISSENPSKRGKGDKIKLALSPGKKEQQFFHVWDLTELGIEPGDKLEYYFEIYDNDGIHGPKRTLSQTKLYEIANRDQLKQQNEKRSNEVKQELEEAMKETRKLAKDIRKLQQKLLEKKELTWQDKKDLEELLKKQEELKKQIDELKKKNENINQQNNEFNPLQQEMLEKQRQLEKMFDELFSDELKKMMEDMQRMMEDQNKDLLKQELEKMELGEKELDKQLDRMLEMYKRFEVEKRMDEQVEELDKLAEEQEKLAEETKEEKGTPEGLKQKQDSLNKEFEKLQEDMDKTDSLNEQLEEPMDYEVPEEEMDSISQEMEEGSDQLKEKENEKASKKQKEAAKKMKDLADKMRQEMKSTEMEQHMEDYETLRGILENLIQLSFDQESLIDELSAIQGYNPKYVELVQKQKKIRDDSKIIEDSLLALSKRAIVLKSYINKQMGQINDNLNRSLYQLSQRQTRDAAVSQQYTMTSMNNLAVMLSEILKNMQDDMMSSDGSGGGSSKKSKPKKGQGDMKKMREMQEQLKKELGKMKGQQENGQSPGSKQWAQMAAQQEMIRRMLQEMKKQLQQEGNGKEAGELQKTIEEMEKLEKDLVNKKLNLETLKRVRDIETRMLEHEKAEQTREQDKKRESKEGKQNERTLPPELEEYLKQKERENELLKNVPAELRPYYKEKIREYFRNISE
ncbi:MAG: hypothetical protein GC180_09405 [Bacteroidetes bacterium]|nr:hypothetical protein [Bacteroidota bacterium]